MASGRGRRLDLTLTCGPANAADGWFTTTRDPWTTNRPSGSFSMRDIGRTRAQRPEPVKIGTRAMDRALVRASG